MREYLQELYKSNWRTFIELALYGVQDGIAYSFYSIKYIFVQPYHQVNSMQFSNGGFSRHKK